MRTPLLAAAAVVSLAGVALAGPNADGTIFAHDANLAYTVDNARYCGLGTAPPSCEGADTEMDNDQSQPMVWKVYAAFATGASPRLKGMTWGIHYDLSIHISACANCCGDPNHGAFEIPGPGWPASDTGTSMVFQNTQTSQLVECYWFAGYGYDAVPAIFQLRDHPDPGLGGMFGDDSVPSELDPIAGYGSLGFNEPGIPICPISSEAGACCVGSTCTISTEFDCPGTWMGPNTVCDPNPCDGVPVQESTWGRIKNDYR